MSFRKTPTLITNLQHGLKGGIKVVFKKFVGIDRQLLYQKFDNNSVNFQNFSDKILHS